MEKKKLELILANLLKQRRQDNETRAYTEHGIQREIQRFQEPVVKEIQKLEHKPEELQVVPVVEEPPDLLKAHDIGINEDYVRKHELPWPSTIVEDLDKVNKLIEAVNKLNQSYGRQKGGLSKKGGHSPQIARLAAVIKDGKKYVKALVRIRNMHEIRSSFTPEEPSGSSPLEGSGLLDVLTDRLIKEPGNDQIKHQIKLTLGQMQGVPKALVAKILRAYNI